MQVEIVDFKSIRIAVMEHRGSTERVNDSVGQFIAWRKESGLSPKEISRSFGIAYDNPDTTEPAEFRFDICGEVTDEVPINRQGVVTKNIPGGRCARVRHYGSHVRIGESIYPLYRNWLPEVVRSYAIFRSISITST